MQVIIGLTISRRRHPGIGADEMLNKGRAESDHGTGPWKNSTLQRISQESILAGYLRTLSQDLFQSYKSIQGKIDLIIQTAAFIWISTRHPLWASFEWIISNVLKHAFPGDRQWITDYHYAREKHRNGESSSVTMEWGLPDDVDKTPQTMGLNLVNGLVKKQLKVKWRYRSTTGTEIRIKFPLLICGRRRSICGQ